MEYLDRGVVRVDWAQIRTSAEPAFRGDDVAGVHMHRRNQRRAQMSDKRDSARPEARILRSSRYVAAKLGREFAVDGRYIDPDLFEDASTHDRDDPAATALTLPWGALEAARRFFRGKLSGVFVLDRFKRSANSVAQGGEPGLDSGATGTIGRKGDRNLAHWPGNRSV